MKTLSLSETPYQMAISEAVDALEKGQLVIMPTDTVYIIAVDATSNLAVKKLIALKDRPAGKPISVFLSIIDEAEHYVSVSHSQRSMLKTLLPGPYTIVLPSLHKVAAEVESEKGTLGIRIPDYPFTQDLAYVFKKPITATSANLSGDSPHYSIESFVKSLSQRKKKMIDLIIDGGKLPRHKPSTVIDLTIGDIKVLRTGDILPEGTAVLTSHSEGETKKHARDLLHSKSEILTHKPLVILLYGDLGAGKTVYVKGIGEEIGIHDIVSPTYVIYYEYPVNKGAIKNLYHFDLYRLKDKEEFFDLGIDTLLQPGTILCIEWSEKSETIQELLKEKAHVVHVNIWHAGPSKRNIVVREEL
ncbi:hypothetical protein A3I56_04785 [Candidatus Roizmanbacteria bacterium RIFCSPLOWO2_02_FULL_43_10]|uniref:L-threonylcarbamoyladenylate synthase n=2 Tax=Candidatus Roizmaniibacteriota TaxID=1752723 RepID=A0A1F7K0R8_9BACT|nr:MAG: hypothetical protein A3D08_03820 [Candidatus Roizmanbacteria bacterium RIFCSPHIGHO2_02_FULL_43_11]OGK61432.1 MAG: hypothetical protein A3I56_04785 [Candidatus Roizmanbacteria bacterium RIFCSPLOWO2_02_FULL_43_10]